jgi:cytochrome c553
MNAHRLIASRASLIALAALALSACNRESPGPPVSSTAPAPSTAASPAASSASAPASAPAQAAAPLVPEQVAAVAVAANEDVSAGQQIATQGAQGAAACASCHGANGEGNGQAGFPRLAALGRPYLEHQLASYADGTRQNPVMQPIAAALNAQQRSVVAAYYASLGGSAPAPTPTAGARTPQPPVLAERGDDRKGIQGCANCHGPQGIGDAAANPYLAGQHAQYLTNALAAWKGGTRNNDPSGQMPAIAKALTDADTSALVAYFAGLPPPAPRNQQAAAVAVNTSRPAVQSGPVAATQPAQGIGTEQGAPLTGGSQGPGSGGAGTNPGQTPNR